MDTKQNSQKQPPVSIYLGDKLEAPPRIARLDEMAKERGVSRSVFIQLILDGIIGLTDSDNPPKYVARYEPERNPF